MSCKFNSKTFWGFRLIIPPRSYPWCYTSGWAYFLALTETSYDWEGGEAKREHFVIQHNNSAPAALRCLVQTQTRNAKSLLHHKFALINPPLCLFANCCKRILVRLLFSDAGALAPGCQEPHTWGLCSSVSKHPLLDQPDMWVIHNPTASSLPPLPQKRTSRWRGCLPPAASWLQGKAPKLPFVHVGDPRPVSKLPPGVPLIRVLASGHEFIQLLSICGCLQQGSF